MSDIRHASKPNAWVDMFSEAVAGGTAGVIATSVIYPLVVLKTVFQAQPTAKEKKKIGFMRKLIHFIKIRGLLGLYRGLSSALPKAFLTNFLFYFSHAFFKPLFQALSKRYARLQFVFSLLHGIAAGVVVQLVVTPIDYLNTKMIMNKKRTGMVSLFLQELREYGGAHFYRGIEPQLLLTLNPGITNVVRSKMEVFLKNSSSLGNFGIGAVSKAVASTATYPLNVCKVALYLDQSHLSTRDAPLSLTNVFKNIVEREGVSSLYKGLFIQLSTAVLKEAFLNMSRHEIKRRVKAIFT